MVFVHETCIAVVGSLEGPDLIDVVLCDSCMLRYESPKERFPYLYHVVVRIPHIHHATTSATDTYFLMKPHGVGKKEGDAPSFPTGSPAYIPIDAYPEGFAVPWQAVEFSAPILFSAADEFLRQSSTRFLSL